MQLYAARIEMMLFDARGIAFRLKRPYPISICSSSLRVAGYSRHEADWTSGADDLHMALLHMMLTSARP